MPVNPHRRLMPLAPLAVASLLSLSACGLYHKVMPEATEDEVVSVQHGKASWYSVRSNRGTRTASGQRLDDQSSTAAHRHLPFGTRVKVTNQANGRSEIVTINNRGPYIRGRIIDVTIGTAERLGFRRNGVAIVKVEVLKRNNEDRDEGKDPR